MTSITAPSMSACCSRWACHKPVLAGDALQSFSKLGVFRSCPPLLPHSRTGWSSLKELAKRCATQPLVASAVTDTTEAIENDVSTSEELSLATPDTKSVRRKRLVRRGSDQPADQSLGTESEVRGGSSAEVAASAGAEANTTTKRQRGRPRKSAEASPAGEAGNVEQGELLEEAATSGVDGQPESEPADAKQGSQKKRVFAQDAKRLKVSKKRAVALLHLLRIENDAAYASLLDRTSQQVSLRVVEKSLGLKIDSLSKPELRQVTELVSSTTKWRRYLDFVIEGVFEREGKKQKAKGAMKQILRLGACEVLKLGQPSHVVNEMVQLTKFIKGGGDNAAKFVNYVLRQVTQMKEAGTLPEPKAGGKVTSADVLGIVHSQPTWIVERWLERYGEEHAIEFLKWNNEVPAFGVRPSAARGVTLDGLKEELAKLAKANKKVEYVESPYLPNVLRVKNGMQAIRELLDEGLCSVQDESAGLVVNLLDPTPGDFIIDTCAAPGGKTFNAAERLKGEGSILALDIHAARLQKLAEVAKKMGLDGVIETGAGDLRYLARNRPRLADKVLVDAPCTGLGVVARRADLRWRKSQANLDELVKLQAELLDAAVAFVKPGGLLVYSTCSVEPEENELQVEAFLERHPEFSIESATPYVPIQAVTARGFYATLPFRDGIDGAFGARLRRAAAS